MIHWVRFYPGADLSAPFYRRTFADVSGIVLPVSWIQAEQDQPNLNAVAGKLRIIHLQDKSFRSDPTTCPPDVPIYTTKSGTVSKRHLLVDRFVALFDKMKKWDIDGVMLEESVMGVWDGAWPTDFSPGAYLAAWKKIASEMRARWERCFLPINYMEGGVDNVRDLLWHCMDNGVGVSTVDTRPWDPALHKHMALVSSARSVIPFACKVDYGNYDFANVRQIKDYAEFLGANIMVWLNRDWDTWLKVRATI